MEGMMQQLTIAVGQMVENQNRMAEKQNQFLTWMMGERGVGGGGGFKGYGKGVGMKGGFKSDGKGSGLKGFEKGYWPEGIGKGGGYQGTCFKCGNVGHKAAECRVHMVGEMGPEDEKPIGKVRSGGNPWVGYTGETAAVQARWSW